jgi:CRISPR/Cas system Type II protein with McrA/HNH and RuvC-like nuclease domain
MGWKDKRICKVCKSEFIPNVATQIYCSENCSYSVVVKKNTEKAIKNKGDANFFIFNRDNFTCIYCGRSSIEDNVKLAIDHIIPVSKGGDNKIKNLVTSCHECNSRKIDNILFDTERILLEVNKRNRLLKIDNNKELKHYFHRTRVNKINKTEKINDLISKIAKLDNRPEDNALEYALEYYLNTLTNKRFLC